MTARTLARVAGVLYLVTFVTSIPALALKRPYLQTGAGVDSLRWAAALEVVLALACLGTAVALYPITHRYQPALILGFVGSRTLEAATIVLGVVSMLAVASIGGPATPGAQALVAVHDWAFLIGPGTLPAVNALLLAPVLLKARLVPRAIPLVGLVGAPLLLGAALAEVLGALDQVSLLGGLAALPIALWELSLGLWLTVRAVPHVAVPTEPGEVVRLREMTTDVGPVPAE